MDIIFNFIIFFLSGFLILKTAELFIKGAVEISFALKLSKVFIGVTIVSLVTTSPELIVSATSSYIGQGGLAVGNAVGSCICNIGLIFAVGAIIQDIVTKKEDFNYRMLSLLIASSIVCFFSANGEISRLEGFILLILLVPFLGLNYHSAIKQRSEIKRQRNEMESGLNIESNGSLLRKGVIPFLIGGVLTVIIVRYGLIYTGLNIAIFFRIPPIMIGLSLVALGTSLPELFTAIVSSRKRHGEIIFGNVVGANILNLLLVLGVAAVIRPLEIDKQTLVFNMPMAILIAIIMFLLGFKNFKFNREKGVILLIIYIFYIGALFTIMYR